MITYPPELLPSPDEGQAADVIVCANYPNCPVANAEISRLTARIEDLEKVLKTLADAVDEETSLLHGSTK